MKRSAYKSIAILLSLLGLFVFSCKQTTKQDGDVSKNVANGDPSLGMPTEITVHGEKITDKKGWAITLPNARVQVATGDVEVFFTSGGGIHLL